MRRPDPHPFLEAERGRPGPGADALVWGITSDGDVSFRAGAAGGPSGIRAFSDSIESFSPAAQRDLADLTLTDLGDHTRGVAGAERTAARIIDAAWTSGRRPLLVTLGGDHAITPPVVRAVARRVGRLAVVGFDAHLDLRKDYLGEHACTYRRIAEAGMRCVVLGPRSGAREEWEDAPSVLAYHARDLTLPAKVRRELERSAVYVTLDIDVLDPSAAPGTGNPEPGGPGFAELLAAVEALQGLDVAAVDVVEVSPPLDPSGITQAAAAVLVREMIVRFA